MHKCFTPDITQKKYTIRFLSTTESHSGFSYCEEQDLVSCRLKDDGKKGRHFYTTTTEQKQDEGKEGSQEEILKVPQLCTE